MPRPLKERIKLGEAFQGINDIWNEDDPLCVSNFTDSEYSCYVTPLLDGLTSGCSIEQIADYYEQAYKRMGEDCTREKSLAFANKVKTWWDNSLDRLMND